MTQTEGTQQINNLDGNKGEETSETSFTNVDVAEIIPKSESPQPVPNITFSNRDEIPSVFRFPRDRSVTQVKIFGQDTESTVRMRAITPSSNILEVSPEEKKFLVKRNLTIMYSCIYAVFLVVSGGYIYINHQGPRKRFVRQIFSSCIMLLGMCWLIFFHFDLYKYKRKALKKMIDTSDDVKEVASSYANFEQSSLAGEFVEDPPYRFLTGRHSGSFYLKAGLAAFCFGHLINGGLQLGQEILYFVEDEKHSENCRQVSAVIVNVLRPIHSFYQLFILFKYSNIVINIHKALARFALMHIIATCLCFWFSAILQDAHEDYQHKLALIGSQTKLQSDDNDMAAPNVTDSGSPCTINTFLSINNLQAIPYLYPFSVEFNLLLAGVWFIVWHNIGKEHERANPHHFHHKISNDNTGMTEVTFQSNLVISADCHASNKGLFFGLFFLLASIVTVIVFFVAMSSSEYIKLGLMVHTIQESTMVIVSLFGVVFAHRQTSKLDINLHPITFLDDVLLFIPLPFYFAHTIATVVAEIRSYNTARIAISVLMAVQTIIQTPFISDGLRRCSNSQVLRYEKPGREIITFLIIANLTMWIVNTFEAKSVESHYAPKQVYGEFVWMFISHATLPLMLFYRFHSSVCLADMWKSAYAKGE